MAVLDACEIGKIIADSARALNIAGCAETYADGNLALGVESELRIEGNYAVNLGKRYSETLGDDFLDLYRKITVDFLSALKNRHEIALNAFILFDERAQSSFLLGCSGKFYRSQFLFHVFDSPPENYICGHAPKM